jgi:hypothetical protein
MQMSTEKMLGFAILQLFTGSAYAIPDWLAYKNL